MTKKSHKPPLVSAGLRSFMQFARPWYSKLAVVAALFAIADILITVMPVFIGRLIDSVSRQPADSHGAWLNVIILIALSSGHDILWRVCEFSYRAFIFPITFAYETHIFRHVIAKPYPYFVDKFTGKIGSYITNMSGELRWLVDNMMFNYIGSLVNVITVIWITSSVNWQTGLLLSVCLVFMFIVGKYTLGKDMAMQKIEADINSTKNGRIIDSIANFVSVKSFHKELSESRVIHQQQTDTLTAARRSFFWGIMFWGSMSVIVRHLMWPGIIVLNLWMFLRGDITVGQFATIVSTALLFTQTVWEIVWNVAQFGQRISRIDEAHRYLFGDEIIGGQSKKLALGATVPVLHRSLAIKGLDFSYPDKPDSAVLTDINLRIKHGEKIGIVGRSGSGKSTLVKLLLDQYGTPDGTFSIDGTAVSSTQLSRLVSYVPQDTTLFHRSIADNISYAANRRISREDVIHAAVQAEADEFIVKLADGYDTRVGERGVKLSGGQRQRIAIARAFLQDSQLLVLDEATSALDSESEIHVQRALENLWQDKTVIAIAHRLSTLRHMDRIVVMDEGSIIEQGTHTELIAQNGTYARLWNHQSGGFIEE